MFTLRTCYVCLILVDVPALLPLKKISMTGQSPTWVIANRCACLFPVR